MQLARRESNPVEQTERSSRSPSVTVQSSSYRQRTPQAQSQPQPQQYPPSASRSSYISPYAQSQTAPRAASHTRVPSGQSSFDPRLLGQNQPSLSQHRSVSGQGSASRHGSVSQQTSQQPEPTPASAHRPAATRSGQTSQQAPRPLLNTSMSTTMQAALRNSPALHDFCTKLPQLFLEPTRANMMLLKDCPRVRVDWDAQRSDFLITRSAVQAQNEPVEAQGPPAMTPQLASVPADQLSELFRQVDVLCRKNQFVFNTGAFAMDSIFRVFGSYKLTAKDLNGLRHKVQSYHGDYQNKLLFQHFLNWCASFLIGKDHVISLVMANPRPVDFPQQMRAVLLPQINKVTFQAIFKFCKHLLDYNASFSNPNSLALFYFRITFTTLAPMLMRLSVNKRSISKAAGAHKQDKNLQEDIQKTYQALGFKPRFQQVDLKIFKWVKNPLKKAKSAQTEHFLRTNVWDDEPPPSAPASYMPQEPQYFSPAASSVSAHSHHQTPGQQPRQQQPQQQQQYFQIDALMSNVSGASGASGASSASGASGASSHRTQHQNPFGTNGAMDNDYYFRTVIRHHRTDTSPSTQRQNPFGTNGAIDDYNLGLDTSMEDNNTATMTGTLFNTPVARRLYFH
ncbi:hypothetical protein V8C44DRAFT_320013 [Trichoderma aethiopicum]